MRICFFVFFLFSFFLCQSQHDEVILEGVYADYLNTVRLHPYDRIGGLPIVELKSNQLLLLSFDDMMGDDRQYVYSIQHCNYDWTPSDVGELEYLQGFSEEYIEDYYFSQNTRSVYTHYSLILPNNEISWKLSGNYVVRVYDITESRELVITKRFMVLESADAVKTSMRMISPRNVSLMQTHHEIDFVVDTKKSNLFNPLQTVRATVLQNQRWDNALEGITPRYVRGEKLFFDYNSRIVFPAGREFRALDLRTFRSNSNRIEQVVRHDDYFTVDLLPDFSLARTVYLFYYDLNGQYSIGTMDNVHPFLGDSSVISTSVPEARYQQRTFAEYGDIHFRLEVEEELPAGNALHILGHFNNFQPSEENRMHYVSDQYMYETTLSMKQGYYDYAYAVVSEADGDIDLTTFQGDWFQTRNQYHVLIYYRPFGGRYDRLIGVSEVVQ